MTSSAISTIALGNFKPVYLFLPRNSKKQELCHAVQGDPFNGKNLFFQRIILFGSREARPCCCQNVNKIAEKEQVLSHFFSFINDTKARKGCFQSKIGNRKLLNHLIRPEEHVLWYHQAELLRGLQVDENLEFCR